MAVAVAVLNQVQLPSGAGTMTRGTFTPTGTYATGGDLANLAEKLKTVGGNNTVDVVLCGFSGDYTAHYNPSNLKLRIYKIASGVMTERSNGSSYDASVAIPFVAFSR